MGRLLSTILVLGLTVGLGSAHAGLGGSWDPFPFLLGLCPLAITFSDCDTFGGGGLCDVYGSFLGEDPFADGVYLGASDEPQNSCQRMPMTFPDH